MVDQPLNLFINTADTISKNYITTQIKDWLSGRARSWQPSQRDTNIHGYLFTSQIMDREELLDKTSNTLKR